jgi:type IV pilus assembly protein PilC
MPVYRYIAQDIKGKEIKGTREASSADEVAMFLRESNLVAVSIYEKVGIDFSQLLSVQIGGVPLRERVVFVKQFSTMLSAGLPLIQAMDILVQQTENKALKTKLAKVYKDVASGISLSEAFKKDKSIFNNVQINLLAAGEKSGNLNEIMLRIAEDLEKSRQLRGKIVGALIYPIILLVVLTFVVVAMLVFMVPAVSDLYKEFGSEAQLPWVTQVLVALSGFLTSSFGSITVLAIVLFVVIGFRYYRATPAGNLATDKWLLKMPIFGNLQQKIQLVQFTRLLSLLLQSGVPIVDALEIIASAMSNKVFTNAIKNAAVQVAKGNPITIPLAREEVFPLMLLKMLATGEETGKLDQVSGDMSKFYEQEVNEITANLTKLMEPVIMVLVGGAVAFLALAIYLPIYQLGQLAT